MPTNSGTPTSANSKNPNGASPAWTAASETMTLMGVPVRASSEPALPANASGIAHRPGDSPSRMARTTTIGNSAATAPLRLISDVTTAHSTSTNTKSRRGRSPANATSRWPAHAVSPVASIPSLTTKRAAMNTTTGSPKPAKASLRVSTPVALNVSAVPSATISTGNQLPTNSTIAAASTTRLTAAGSMESEATGFSKPGHRAALVSSRF